VGRLKPGVRERSRIGPECRLHCPRTSFCDGLSVQGARFLCSGLVSVQGGVYGQSLAPGLCPRRQGSVNSDVNPITAGHRTHDPMVLKRRDDSRSVAESCLESLGRSKRRKLFPCLSTRSSHLPLRVPAQGSVSDQSIPPECSWTPWSNASSPVDGPRSPDVRFRLYFSIYSAIRFSSHGHVLLRNA
jgi:hypothetical protein